MLVTREDPVVLEDLGTPPPCIGVGLAWGSLLLESADRSLGERVYLDIGFRSNGSDQAVEICPPPG